MMLQSNSALARGLSSRTRTLRCAGAASRCRVVAPALRSADSLDSSRRHMLLAGSAFLVPGLVQPMVALADEAAVSIYSEDGLDKFNITPPQGWSFGEGKIDGAAGQRRTLAWFPEGANAGDVNITLVITNVSVEFTQLGSFGNVDAFAGNLINSLDRSYMLKKGSNWGKTPEEPVQIAKLVDYKARGGQYTIEYTVQKLPEPQRHLFSAVQLGNNGRYNRLYTVTAQCLESDLEKYRPQMEATMNSFRAKVI